MDIKPFTFEDAEEILEDFEDLIDTEFVWEDRMVIVDGLLVCPYNSTDKDVFFEAYSKGEDLDDIMESYKGDDFDVIIAVCDVANEDLVSYISIGDYVTQKGINYNLPPV